MTIAPSIVIEYGPSPDRLGGTRLRIVAGTLQIERMTLPDRMAFLPFVHGEAVADLLQEMDARERAAFMALLDRLNGGIRQYKTRQGMP